MYRSKQHGSRFVVDLGNFKLPENVELDVEAGIQKVVLRALSELDFRGDKGGLNRFPPGLFGIVPPDFPEFPPIFDQPPIPHLTKEDVDDILSLDKGSIARDHTRIVKTVMENPLLLLRNLPSKSGGPFRASTTDILTAVERITSVDAYTKKRVQLISKLWPAVQRAQLDIAAPTRMALDELNKEIIGAKDINDMISRLRSMKKSQTYDKYEGMTIGIDLALEALEDGKDSIYSADFPFYNLLNSDGSGGTQIILSVAGADVGGLVGGAVVGAASGSVVPGVGTVAGAVAGGLAGGAGSSISEAVEELWDWLWD